MTYLIHLTAMKFVLPKDSGHLKFSIKEVYSATNNLHAKNFIGEGIAGEAFANICRLKCYSFVYSLINSINCLLGKVYKGVLPNKQHVAIKQITDEGYTETFLRELKSLAKVRHPNLVALLGYCRHKDECFLLYELCPNGNLSEWIFGTLISTILFLCISFFVHLVWCY